MILFFILYGIIIGLLLRALLAPFVLSPDYGAYSYDVFFCRGLGLSPSYSALERAWVFDSPLLALEENYFVSSFLLSGGVCCGVPPLCNNFSWYIS